jgi:hypothetical protein
LLSVAYSGAQQGMGAYRMVGERMWEGTCSKRRCGIF